MTPSFRHRLARPICGFALLLLAGLAQAQYVWVDEKGVRHFSDRPPPPSTPASKILKAPGRSSAVETPADKPAEGAKESKPASQPTLAEREADFRKRQQERAKDEQKAAEEAQHKKAQAENCDNARRYKSTLESGMRIADTDDKGERGYISDEERAKRLAKANKVLESCR